MYHNELLTLASSWSDLQSIISHRAGNTENFCLIMHKSSFFLMSRTGQKHANYFLRVRIWTFQMTVTVTMEKLHTAHVRL